MKKITIAIDGHSSCGKSTMAKDLAREVGYVYVDTGAMYRSVTLYALRNGIFESAEAQKSAECRVQSAELKAAPAVQSAEAEKNAKGRDIIATYQRKEGQKSAEGRVQSAELKAALAVQSAEAEKSAEGRDIIATCQGKEGQKKQEVGLIINEEKLRKEMDNIHISFKFNAETGRPDTYLNGELVEQDIRTMEVSSHVSPIAALGFVREAMVAQQQEMGRDGGVVMDGRDIGTVVFPHAELKIFVTASAEVRAQRRYDELKSKGMEADYAEILKNVQERDYIDSHREVSPLKQASDAILLDNSQMTIAEQKEWLMQRFKEVAGE